MLRCDLLKLAERPGQREPAAACLVDAPFEQGVQQLLLFEEKEASSVMYTISL